MKACETYTYGKGRTSYYNHQTGDTYQYLTNQSGSVTGLTKEGQTVASTSYHLYGSTKSTTDQTGNPFAYNGEARDVTGLDYLRARYYDHQVGTFLTEDSYQGDDRDPLSQNLYSYVQNNPVNYTDPSGHRAMGLLGGGGRRRKPKPSTKSYPIFPSGTPIEKRLPVINNPQAANALIQQQRKTLQLPQHPTLPAFMGGGPNAFTNITNSFVTSYNSAYQYAQSQTGNAQHSAMTALQAAIYSGESTYNWEKSKSKEGANIHRNWTKALEEQQRHVCIVAGKADGGSQKKLSSFNSSHYASTQDFKNNLMEQYGFNQQTADLMWKLYQNIKDKEGKNADYIFNRLMGGAQYDGFLWRQTAGNIGEIKSELRKYGISGSQAEELVYNIRIQYFLSSGTYGDVNSLKNQGLYDSFKSRAKKVYPDVDFDILWNDKYTRYRGKTDFAHQSITTATHLHDKPRPANIYGSLYGGIEQLAGWRGDVTKDALARPSMGNDDYRADLDTVNITSIMKKSNIDYISASNLYYDGISSGAYTRANVFKQNISLDYVKKAIYSSLVPRKSVILGPNIQSNIPRTDAESMEYLRRNYEASYNFIKNLEAGNNEFKDYTKSP